MEIKEKTNIKSYLEIANRRKWFFIIPFIMVSIGIFFYYKSLPKIYKATTLILVEPQKVPANYVRPTVTDNVQNQLRTITEQIMSRSYLEKVIKEFDLYHKKRKKLSLESIIENMRSWIEVEVRKGRVFSVSFEDKDPTLAMKVANRLASMFIEENLKIREQQAEGTLVFLKRELERVRSVLKKQEKKISDFRAQNLGVLPEQLDANLRTLDRLQLQLQNLEESLQTSLQARAQLQRQISRLSVNPKSSFIELGSDSSTLDASQLKILKEKLASLKVNYTDKHPEVIRIKKAISDLEKMSNNSASYGSDKDKKTSNINPWLLQMKNQLIQIDNEIAKLKKEKKTTLFKIKEYQKRVEITPKVEQKLQELSRGYNVTKKQYQSLLDKILQAELAANMERKQKGEQFKILDPAQMPEKPYKPNTMVFLLFGFILSTGVGFGSAFLAEYMDNHFYKPEDIESFSKLPVLSSIPEVKIK